MKKIILTGATGFIGFNLLKKLLDNNLEILMISRNNLEFNNKNLIKIKEDLRNIDNFIDKIISFEPEVIVHLAWDGIPDFSFEKSLLNLSTSIKFLSKVRNFCNIKKIVVAGSCYELGENPVGSFGERDIGTPYNYFTWAKHSLRNWLEIDARKYSYDYAWMRLFYVFGPGQRKDSLIPYLFNAFIKGEIPLIKSINNKNDFIFIDDVISAFHNSIQSNFNSGIFNIGFGKTTTVLEIVKEIQEILYNSNFEKTLEYSTPQESKCQEFWSDNKLTCKELNWVPKFDPKEGLKITISNYLSK